MVFGASFAIVESSSRGTGFRRMVLYKLIIYAVRSGRIDYPAMAIKKPAAEKPPVWIRKRRLN
jgi:hypothetical protein